MRNVGPESGLHLSPSDSVDGSPSHSIAARFGRTTGENRKRAGLSLWRLYPLFFVAVYLSHWKLLNLPYFWDEGGYYIPAALDFFRTGTLIPVSTMTNAHPPIPSILLAGWWHLSGFNINGTRTLVCMVAAAGLLGVYRLAERTCGTAVAVATTLLTALYPVWFAQSTLAHADIFAAAFTLWALAFYIDGALLDSAVDGAQFDSTRLRVSASFEDAAAGLEGGGAPLRAATHPRTRLQILTAILFALAALSKETAIVTPAALALWELIGMVRTRRVRPRLGWLLALASTVLPLIGWYAYHYHRTGFVFGNPEYLRYNATANLDAHRILLCLYHRALHLTAHMNMFVPVLCAAAALLMPRLTDPNRQSRGLTPRVLGALWTVLLVHWVAFSVLGGALLTRYLLPDYPLILLLCCAAWHAHMRAWWGAAAFSAVAFVAGIFINPPYAFAPEDNLTYRDMIVLHQRAIAVIDRNFPDAHVLTAWPANAELMRPELGYTNRPIATVSLNNFSADQILKAADEPGEFDTALIFSTKWEPAAGAVNLSAGHKQADAKYFDFHQDLSPTDVAHLLHGDIVWQQRIRGEWAAVLRFPRSMDARLLSFSIRAAR
jgi:4-amino-4-deoxy-L-arabinose transferase-like glycosyltransferase